MTADEKSVEETTAAEGSTEAEETTKAEAPAEAEPAEDVEDYDKAPGRWKRLAAQAKTRSSGKVIPAMLALFVVASLALLGGLYWFSYRPDRATDAAAAKSAISAASDGTVAVLSYSPDTLDRDFSSAKSHLTGDFLSYYDQFTQQIVAPAAKQKSVKTSAVVLRAAVSDLHPDSAVVLLFVNQSTQSKDRPEPTFTNSSVTVTLTKANGKWLISSFNPV
ncbi:twin-arginine translocation pathway signal [Mycobacterium sp. 1081908.1]|uniref:twin-arginine translocation pathway signal n=1 Tax=Mycobacterium sp. 1081908.1 TaxID=1834066 RepID=UPI0007FC3D35|nr:twin-arginine translocation pathway signal [Mycobacterium sp. 1081908.1]OBK47547.1 twin-arginine translocation pathway signal [Mycobacterium sp. 1081908.1]